jgi:hypothetical protein
MRKIMSLLCFFMVFVHTKANYLEIVCLFQLINTTYKNLS